MSIALNVAFVEPGFYSSVRGARAAIVQALDEANATRFRTAEATAEVLIRLLDASEKAGHLVFRVQRDALREPGLSEAQVRVAILKLEHWSLIDRETEGPVLWVHLNAGLISDVATGRVTGRDLDAMARGKGSRWFLPRGKNLEFSRVARHNLKFSRVAYRYDPSRAYARARDIVTYVTGTSNESTVNNVNSASDSGVQAIVTQTDASLRSASVSCGSLSEPQTVTTAWQPQGSGNIPVQNSGEAKNAQCEAETEADRVKEILESALRVLQLHPLLREEFQARVMAIKPLENWPPRLSRRARAALEEAGYTPDNVRDATPEALMKLNAVGEKTAVALTGKLLSPAIPAEIQAIRDACNRTPPRASWPALIPLVGKQTAEELGVKYAEWTARGWNSANFAGWVAIDLAQIRAPRSDMRAHETEQVHVNETVDAEFLAMLRAQPADSYLRQVYAAELDGDA